MTKGEKIKPGKSIIKFIQGTVGQYLELITNKKKAFFITFENYFCLNLFISVLARDVFVIRLIITQTPCSNTERFIVSVF